MGTSCNIGILNSNGSVELIYCHWDGYISGVGKLLKSAYTDILKIRTLISLGDISSLGQHLYPSDTKLHTFDNPENDVTVAYCRDRHDPWWLCKPDTYPSVNYYGKRCKTDYCYLYDTKDNIWKVWDGKNFVIYRG